MTVYVIVRGVIFSEIAFEFDGVSGILAAPVGRINPLNKKWTAGFYDGMNRLSMTNNHYGNYVLNGGFCRRCRGVIRGLDSDSLVACLSLFQSHIVRGRYEF